MSFRKSNETFQHSNSTLAIPVKSDWRLKAEILLNDLHTRFRVNIAHELYLTKQCKTANRQVTNFDPFNTWMSLLLSKVRLKQERAIFSSNSSFIGSNKTKTKSNLLSKGEDIFKAPVKSHPEAKEFDLAKLHGAIIGHRVISICITIPALAILMLCCSIASWILVLQASEMQENHQYNKHHCQPRQSTCLPKPTHWILVIAQAVNPAYVVPMPQEE